MCRLAGRCRGRPGRRRATGRAAGPGRQPISSLAPGRRLRARSQPNPTFVVPKPGRLQVHPVDAATIEPRLVGRRVFVKLTWWSGVEPCSVLDSVGVARTGNAIDLTIREGADRLDVACIEIALLKATVVDLGELAPGTYTISAGAQATPVQVVVELTRRGRRGRASPSSSILGR